MPIKQLDLAKSRLALPAGHRRELAHAMAIDTAAAVLAADLVGRLIVVTNDDDVAASLSSLGAEAVRDAPDAGLNPALAHGVVVARSVNPGAAVATVAADLPTLRSSELTEFLALVTSTAIVADFAGAGTTLLAAAAGFDVTPRFGPDSRREHVAAGAVDLSDDTGPSLHVDVDTVTDLQIAATIGLGPRTSIAARAAGCIS